MWYELRLEIYNGKLTENSMNIILERLLQNGFFYDNCGALLSNKFKSYHAVIDCMEQILEENARVEAGEPIAAVYVYYGNGVEPNTSYEETAECCQMLMTIIKK